MPVKKCDEIEEVVESTDPIEFVPGPKEAPPTPSQISENVYLGKNITAVESNIYDASSVDLEPVSVFGDGFVTITRPPDIADALRAETRKFFALDKDGRAVYVSPDVNAKSAINATQNYYGPSPITIGFGQVSELLPLFGSETWFNFTQEIEITSEFFRTSGTWGVIKFGGEQTLSDSTVFSRPAPIINTEQTFTDHFTKIVAPFSQQELELFLNNVNNPAYANVESKYNFFVPGYEDYISSGDIEEYYLENQFSNITRDDSALQQKLHALGSDLQYVKNFLETPTGISLTKLKNIGIPQQSVSSIKKVTDTDDLYPIINTIELNTAQTGKFGLATEEAAMTDELLKHVMDQTIVYPGSVAFKSANNALEFLVATESLAFAQNKSFIETSAVTTKLPLISIQPWLQSYFDGSPEQVDEEFDRVAILLGIDPAAAQQSEDCSAFTNTLKSLILTGKITSIVKDNFRSYQEMIEGKEAYNETIIYQIFKIRNDTGVGQSIFIPNTQELDLLQYIDTQIKYDTGYRYEIYAHQLIVGTQYSYEEVEEETQGGGGASILTETQSYPLRVAYQPSLQIVRIPIFSQVARVLDDAPVFPNVDIVPYKGIGNRLLINLDNNTGNYELQPIIITEEDSIFVDKFRSSRGLAATDPITFSTDDPVTQFEIYRLSEPPQSYSDFNNQLLATVSTPNATSTSFIDAIEPNTKYYYTFRCIDIHENRSNPTEVYVVELVQFEGMIFFNQSIYEFGSEAYNNVKPTREFRRYLKINPNLIQSLINYDDLSTATSAYDASSIKLGKADESVWTKNFKMRITSKHSGKKFDINLSCKVNFTKNTSASPAQNAAAASEEARKKGFK